MKKPNLIRLILPQLLALVTGKDRYLPEIEWSSRLWTHNAFRMWEAVFGRAYGKNGKGDTIRAEVSVMVDNDGERKIVSYQFHTFEAVLAHAEGMIRGMVPKLVPVRVAIPQFAGGPSWLPNPASPYLFAIAFDAVGSNNAGSTSPTTANVTVSGSNRLMMLRTGSVSDTDTAYTYNGDGFTAVPSGKSSYLGAAREGVALYYLIAPDTGTNSLSVSHSSNGKRIWGVSYTGAHQSTPIDSSTNAAPGGAATTTSPTTTVVAANCWLFAGVSTDQGGETAGASTTERGSAAGGSITVDSNGTVGTGSQSLNVTHSSTSTRAYAIASIAPVGSTEYTQSVDATTSVSASMLTPKTIVQTVSAAVSGSASVSMIKDFVRTLEATATATASVLKGLAMSLEATVTVTATTLAERVYLVTMDVLTSATASLTKTVGYVRTLSAGATATASIAKQLALSAVLDAAVSITATIAATREVVMNAAVATTVTITTAIGKTLTASVSILAKISAPFWRTKYPAHGDGEDYEIKYPHD